MGLVTEPAVNSKSHTSKLQHKNYWERRKFIYFPAGPVGNPDPHLYARRARARRFWKQGTAERLLCM